MPSRHICLCVPVLALTLPSFLAQESEGQFKALKHALALSNGQVSRLQQLNPSAAARARIAYQDANRLRNQVLDDGQRAKLAAMGTALLGPGDVARLAARLGLVNLKDWERRFGGTCLFASIQPYSYYTEATDVPLSREQAERLEKLQQATPGTPLSREVVMEVLDTAQKTKLATFETDLQAASEAIQLGLFAPSGEVLCH